jgi:VWFA-related protein
LIDTVYLALTRMRHANRPRRAIPLLSDGMDNHSRYSKAELMHMALEADTQIYTIIFDNPPAYKKAIEVSEEHRGRYFLEELSQRTGGIHFGVRDVVEAKVAAVKAARAPRNKYVIEYQPQQPVESGKWHSVRVKSNVPGANVYARNGYYER